MVSFQAPSTVVCLEKKPPTKICFQVTGIPSFQQGLSGCSSEPGWAPAATEICQGKNGPEEAAAPVYSSFILDRGGTMFVCTSLYLCEASVPIDDLG